MAPVRVVQSRSHARLLKAAATFASEYPETLVLEANSRSGESLALFSGGAAGIHERSLGQLAAEMASGAMAERRLAPLTALGMEAVLAQVVHEAVNRRQLQYFSPVARLPHFPRALAKTIGELRLARVPAPQIEGRGPAGVDLARLLSAYDHQLEERRLADLALILRLAAEAARNGQGLAGLPLILLDAPLDWKAHREFFEALAARASAVLVALGPHETPLGPPFPSPEALDPDAPEDELDHLRRYLFVAAPKPCPARGRFEFFSAPGEGLEAAEIARRILALAREGTPFDHIAILLRAPDRYQPMVEEALRRARIPAWFSRGAARPEPSGRAFLALLACAAEKVSASRFAEYMSLGQIPRGDAWAQWVAPEDDLLPGGISRYDTETPSVEDAPPSVPAPSAWEKLLVDAAVINGKDRWERRLQGLEKEFELRLAGLKEDDAGRHHQLRQLELLRSLKRFALPLVNALWEFPESAGWGVWIERLGALARASLRDPEPVLAVLAELAPMSEVGPATLEQVTGVLSERLGFLRLNPPRRRWGAVFVGSIEEARAREFRVVFLPGLAEGLFPQRALEDPLLLDEAREAIGGLPLREDRAREERRLLRIAAAAAGERLVASYPRMDVAAARPRVPSFYALELPRAIAGALPGIDEFEKQAREAAPARLNRPGPKRAEDAIDEAEFDLVSVEEARAGRGGARYLLDVNPSLARSLRARYARWSLGPWKEADGLVTLAPAALAALRGHRLAERAWSPSSLEKFAICPYQFALYGIHRLQPREDPEVLERLDPRTRGALFHRVQFALLAELKEAGLLPFAPDRLSEITRRCDRALDRVAAEYEEQLAPAIPRVWAAEIEDLRTDLRGWLQHATRDDDEWEPVHFELAFGLAERTGQGRDAASIAEEAVIDEGARLRGSIDLVEKHAVRGVFRVTDHKTGKPPERVPQWVGGGKALQPLLYAVALERLLKTQVESGRLFYATQRGGFQQMEIKIDPRARAVLGRLLADVDGTIAEGFLPPYPEKDACSVCDYRPVCGPHEERRTARKNRDPRLEPLIEIRGMA